MRSKKISLSHFSRAITAESLCLRPDSEKELLEFLIKNKPTSLLARGAGLSYSDCCFNTMGAVIDTQRLNHLIHFNSTTGVLECQGGVRFQDLFLVHPEFIPPVLPGTVQATVAGGVAHDVHGKNNHKAGSFGEHVLWMDLLINDKLIRCSREEEPSLFHATIAGLGLTGLILRLGIRLQKASRYVQVEYQQHDQIQPLIDHMATQGLQQDYQVAWLDLLNDRPRGVLSLASYCDPIAPKVESIHSLPKIPFGLIKAWNMKLFNGFYYHLKRSPQKVSLLQFNNPLDQIKHWNRLYGPKGLIQFQAVFAQDQAAETLNQLIDLMRAHQATPTLAVLKLFTQPGTGLLSFCQPGFSLAVDFIHNQQARKAISAMNQLITEQQGRVYLAKDLLLDAAEFNKMYPNHQQLSQTLATYHCTMNSLLAQRLGIK